MKHLLIIFLLTFTPSFLHAETIIPPGCDGTPNKDERGKLEDGKKFRYLCGSEGQGMIAYCEGERDFMAHIGDFEQGHTGTFIADLRGSRGAQCPLLAATKVVHIRGSLVVNLLNGFVPKEGDEFPLIKAEEVVGEFDNAQNYVKVNPSGVFDIVYSKNTVKLTHYRKY
jgi:hypothetical protein